MSRRTLWSVLHWILWVLCILLVLPTITNVPGNPTTFGLALYLASITHYPVLLPIFAILDVRARAAGKARASLTYRMAIWVIFTFTLVILATFFGTMAAGDPGQPVQNAGGPSAGSPDSEPRPFEEPILKRDPEAVRRLIDAGADVDQRMFNGETPSIMAARTENWKIVLILLESGADASLENRMGTTVSKMARTSRVVPDGEEGRALARVRAVLREQGLY